MRTGGGAGMATGAGVGERGVRGRSPVESGGRITRLRPGMANAAKRTGSIGRGLGSNGRVVRGAVATCREVGARLRGMG